MNHQERRRDVNLDRQSIRVHYRVLALIIGGVLFLCTLSAHFYVAKQSSIATTNIHGNEELAKLISALQTKLSENTHILNDHLIFASKESMARWQKNYTEIHDLLTGIAKSKWLDKNSQKEVLQQLAIKLQDLKSNSIILLNIRLQVDQQYPALYYARSTMLPLNGQFISTANLAMQTIQRRSLTTDQYVYDQFVQARTLWLQIITQFRMYIINRLSSIAEHDLDTQTHDIEIFSRELVVLLNDLKSNKRVGLDFEQLELVDRMLGLARRWHEDFRKVKIINKSNSWRLDRVLRTDKLDPSIKEIAGMVHALQRNIDANLSSEITLLSNTATNLITILWTITLIGLLIVVVVYKFLDKSLLMPIENMARAFNAEAAGQENVIVPQGEYRETRNLVNAFSSMRKQIHVRQSLLEYQASHDTLTRLPNRNLLLVRLQEALERNKEGMCITMMIFDLNRFKEVNDSLGHHIGDRVLEVVGRRVQKLLRETDIVARWGGDEFAVMLSDMEESNALLIAEKLSMALAQVIIIDNQSLYVGASIGIAIYPQHGADTDGLLKNADSAMYIAKRGGLRFYLYSRCEAKNIAVNTRIVDGLQQAIQNKKLFLMLQPIVDLKSNATVGVEVLLRWHHVHHGYITPNDIVTIAEHNGYINELMSWVIHESLQLLRDLDTQLSTQVDYIAVNVSLLSLKDLDFVANVLRYLTQSGISPSRLMLEVPEEVIASESRHVLDSIFKLSEAGVQLAIDNYGNGNTSLSVLRRLPISTLKINKEFVTTMSDNENNAVIVRSTINLAHNLGLKVIAVGIENHDILDLTQMLESDAGQGFYISKPMLPQEFIVWAQP